MYCSPEYTYIDTVEDYQTGQPYVLPFSGRVLWVFFFLIYRSIQIFDCLLFIKAFVYFSGTENATKILVYF